MKTPMTKEQIDALINNAKVQQSHRNKTLFIQLQASTGEVGVGTAHLVIPAERKVALTARVIAASYASGRLREKLMEGRPILPPPSNARPDQRKKHYTGPRAL